MTTSMAGLTKALAPSMFANVGFFTKINNEGVKKIQRRNDDEIPVRLAARLLPYVCRL